MNVVWHDLECGGYVEDLALWRALAETYGDPILEVGAGTGRVALDLARRGHRVTALDRDADLVDELARRAHGLGNLSTVVADARAFELPERFGLCLVPMQTIQLLGGPAGRAECLRCMKRHLAPGGALAVAIADSLELYDTSLGGPVPVPDMCERDGVVYSSSPTAVRDDGDGFVLERRRETVEPYGRRSAVMNTIRLDRLTPAQLEREGVAAGLTVAGREQVAATLDYVGSAVVVLSG
jgi:SAM-dependent methyltransferase